jgi:hypothetical protein
MIRIDQWFQPYSHTSLFPVERALIDSRPSPRWQLFKGQRAPQKTRHAALLGSGTRMGQALLKRLADQNLKKMRKPIARVS